MAKSPQSARSFFLRASGWVAIAAIVLVGAGVVAFRDEAKGYARVSAAYSARVACSCRYLGERSLKDCEKDKLDGMEWVTLAEDEEARTITARFPLLASDTAYFVEGEGCYLVPWTP